MKMRSRSDDTYQTDIYFGWRVVSLALTPHLPISIFTLKSFHTTNTVDLFLIVKKTDQNTKN